LKVRGLFEQTSFSISIIYIHLPHSRFPLFPLPTLHNFFTQLSQPPLPRNKSSSSNPAARNIMQENDFRRPSPRREIPIYKNYAPSLRNHELPFLFLFKTTQCQSQFHSHSPPSIIIIQQEESISRTPRIPSLMRSMPRNGRSILPIKQILKICAGRTFSSAIPLAQIQRTGTLHAPSFSTIGWTIRRRGSWVSVCLRKVGHIDGWLLMPEGNV
jgi:hypothetical protein